MLKLITFITFLISPDLYSQIDQVVPIVGNAKNDIVFLSKTLNNCNFNFDIQVSDNSSLTLGGIYTCETAYTKNYYYKVYVGKDSLYVNVEDVELEQKYYDYLLNTTEQELSAYEQKVRSHVASIFDKLRTEGVEHIKRHASKGITVAQFSFYDEGEYTDGKGVDITYYNPTKKTVKYVWATFVGYNPVNDAVFDPIKQKKFIELKSVGPIEPYKMGEYNFEYAWFTDLVTTIHLVSLKVQYMDGSFKNITVAKDVILPPIYSFLLYE